MLVITRYRDEEIVIGDDIIITLVDIRRDKVRLGIDAPAEMPVHRQEVYVAIEKEFQKSLRDGAYIDAYHRLIENSYRANQDQISRLISGLESAGQLTPEMREYLDSYKNETKKL